MSDNFTVFTDADFEEIQKATNDALAEIYSVPVPPSDESGNWYCMECGKPVVVAQKGLLKAFPRWIVAMSVKMFGTVLCGSCLAKRINIVTGDKGGEPNDEAENEREAGHDSIF